MTKTFSSARIFTAAFLSGCFFICSCENSMEEVNSLNVKRASVDVVDSVTSYMSQAGIVKAKLTAPVMTRTDADTPLVEFPKSLQVEFYDDSTKPESHLFARYGKYLEKQGKVFLRDSVFVFNMKKGDTMLTNELWWDKNKEIFYNSKPVIIKQAGNQNMRGDSIIADQNFNSYTLFNGSGLRNIPDSSLPK
ncbi:LPS export ABC transporter periplasmic protein LptC [Panacibacter sp. DH6]|uniref:LPS export ABC transporter periplasmic protein LptC n=1 Tax=Panacibacter microcysteis TaxID=2793269 RepID=A0A931E7I3_9BACT|nr:LPS export ABC transporter periplasmic protein LptC [Panacibacter microcysteis]MBG9375181.1 LPS export ABC transporter periplasmic protein LptC [Panacibacter microcysteis]